MIDISLISRRYEVRRLCDEDAEIILSLYRENPQFYEYCAERPTMAQVHDDMYIAPPDKDLKDKYFIGFFDSETLIAVMDLIDGYPTDDTAYIGLFMMKKDYQGKQIGSAIIRDTEAYLKTAGISAIRLAINRGNPQSTHFWKKNGFEIIKEADRNGFKMLVAEKRI